MPEFAAARPASPTSRSTPASSPPPARGCARRSPRPSACSTAPASPTRVCRPPGHHAGPDWFAGYCYLNTAAAAAQTLRDGGLRAGRHPRPRPALPERHLGDRRARWTRRQPALAARLRRSPTSPPGRCCRSSERERVVEFAGSPDAGDLPATRSRARSTTLAETRRGAGRLARLRHRRRRPARRLGLRARDLRRDRRACSPPRAAGLRRPGGRLRARRARRLQPRLRHRPARRMACRGEAQPMSAPTGSGERARAVPPPPRRDRRRDRPPARRALPDLPRSRRLQERARDPDDAARPGRDRARALPRARRRGRPAGRLHRRPLRPPDRRHLQGSRTS